MNCAYHADVESSAFCSRCGKAICTSCLREVRGNGYCENCLAEGIDGRSSGVRQAARTLGGTSPEAAFFLGLIPGVGAIYNAEYFKAALHLLVFGILITFGDAGGAVSGLFALLAFGCFVYMPFEAYYTAKKRKLAREGIDMETPFDQFNEQLGRFKNRELWGGIVLVVIGSLYLLDNFEVIRIYQVARLWPVGLIVAGILLIKRFQERHPDDGTSDSHHAWSAAAAKEFLSGCL